MKTALICWIELDGDLSFIIVSCSDAELEKLKTFHNKLINASNVSDELASEISDFFYGPDWHLKHTKTSEPLRDRSFDLVITTGII